MTNRRKQNDAVVGDFVPAYDADGNAILIKTATGTWSVSYNPENRPVRFECAGTQTVVEMNYDYLGRRFEKKITVAGTTTLHHRYIYRGFLQIACLDLTRAGTPALWFVFWDPTQPTGTRPLAIQKNGSWFVYGHDLTKNVCEVFGSDGYIKTTYSYSPFGNVSPVGNFEQNFQWSSEFYDPELSLVYYNYRHYSPTTARWLSRDPIEEQGGLNLYWFVANNSTGYFDILGMGDFTIPIDAYLLAVKINVSYGIDVSISNVANAAECPEFSPDDMNPYMDVGTFKYGVFAKGGLKGEKSDITAQIRLGVEVSGDTVFERLWNFQTVSEVSISTNLEWQRLQIVSPNNICKCINIKGYANMTIETEVRIVRLAAVAVLVETLPVLIPAAISKTTVAISTAMAALSASAFAGE